MKRFLMMAALTGACTGTIVAQTPLDWHLQTPGLDSIWGASVTKAYDVLKNVKPAKQVVVAVISRGFDTEHEDLKDVLWVNQKETAGNGRDDDKNGYTDDVHGWNFLGTADGRDVLYTGNATTRAFDKKRARFEMLWEKRRNRTDWENAEVMKDIMNARKSDVEAAYMTYMFKKNIAWGMEDLDKQLHEKFPGCDDFTLEQFNTLVPSDEENHRDSLNTMAFYVTSMVWGFSPNRGDWNKRYASRFEGLEEARQAYEQLRARQKDERSTIGDNLNDLNDRLYGNANLMTGNPSVGTGLAGVIGAVRGNDIGIDGIADNVRLMLIRAVPEGDEYDKDIAEAILYAVNNGADIVLVAAHKLAADNETLIKQALDVAEKSNVLIIHPVGERAMDEDGDTSYPSGWKEKDVRYNNFISVAASNVEGLPLTMTNYGRKSVDLFAPGVAVYSCDAGDNYFKLTGTNASGAVVAGVAALLKSRFPKMTAAQLKDYIVSTAKTAPQTGVFRPFNPSEGVNNMRPAEYSQLCVSGGIIDAAAAAQKAMGGGNSAQEDGQNLERLRVAYEKNVMDTQATLSYMKALKAQKDYDKALYSKLANDYAMLSAFYVLAKETTAVETMTEEQRQIDPLAIKKMGLPLNKLRQTQVDFLVADSQKDVKKMTALARKMVTFDLPEGSICDAVVLGLILQKTIEAGTLDDSRSFVSFLKKTAEKSNLNPRVLPHVKTAIENGEGYVMLQEYEAQEGK